MLYWPLGVFGIGAVLAFLIGRLAHASDGSEGAIQNTNDLAEGNFFRRFNQRVASLHSSTARKEAGSFQGRQDLFKKFDRDMLACCNLVALQCHLAVNEGELEQCAKSVLTLLRELHVGSNKDF